MGKRLFTNNATTTIAAGISNSATSVSMSSGTGALFPSIAGGSGNTFAATLIKNGNTAIYEIVLVTVTAGDVFTITRAQESTAALSWNAGDTFALLPTAADMAAFSQSADTQAQAGNYAVDTGATNAIVVALSPALTAHVVGLPIRFKAANTNTGASTFNDGAGAVNLVLHTGTAISAGAVQAGGIYTVVWDGTQFQLEFSVPDVRTPAEIAASITPTYMIFDEGNIKRYGAQTSLTDNSTAINNALLVSGATGPTGGNAVFIPPGTWKITSSVAANGNCSMYGMGSSSILAPQNCHGITFGASAAYGAPRFFRDFAITGNNTVNSTYAGILANVAAGAGQIQVTIDNVGIQNFEYGIYARGFWNSNFNRVFIYNVYQGIYFIGQSVQTNITNCNIIRGSMGGSGGAYGISMQEYVPGLETTQATHIAGCNVYNFDHNIEVTLGYEVQIEHCDLSVATKIGVNIVTTIGGVWVRDCWIEMIGGATGTIGVNVAPLAVVNYNDIHINSNHIVCDAPFAGSQGIVVNVPQYGTEVIDNLVTGFDQGIYVFAAENPIVRDNRVNCVTSVYSASSFAIQVNQLTASPIIGPNTIIAGNPTLSPSYFQPCTMTNASANIVVTSAPNFPVGTPVQFDASQNGFVVGVTYFVVGFGASYIQVGAYPGAAAIAAIGNAAVNVFAAPLPLTLQGQSPTGLSFYGQGKFILGLSDPAISGACGWSANGKTISLAPVSALTGTSAATSMAGTGLPSFLWPNNAQGLQGFLTAMENNAVGGIGYGTISSLGVLSFYASPPAGAWASSGAKGLYPAPITYAIA